MAFLRAIETIEELKYIRNPGIMVVHGTQSNSASIYGDSYSGSAIDFNEQGNIIGVGAARNTGSVKLYEFTSVPGLKWAIAISMTSLAPQSRYPPLEYLPHRAIF